MRDLERDLERERKREREREREREMRERDERERERVCVPHTSQRDITAVYGAHSRRLLILLISAFYFITLSNYNEEY